MPPIIVVHHSADFDGLFCREIARRRFGEEAEYVGWDYGDPIPAVPQDAALFMLDISIDALMDHPDLSWIDHHKTAIDKHGPRPGLQIDGVAACRLAWQYFFASPEDDELIHDKDRYVDRRWDDEPLAVRLAGEFDIWDKRDERAELLQLGLRSVDLTHGRWRKLLSPGIASESQVKEMVERGRIVSAYKATTDAEMITRYGFDVEWQGLTFLALNTSICNSLTFTAGIKAHHDALLAFRYSGGKYTVSLYGVPHKPDFDLSVIATQHGGGGHRQACGFQADRLPFLFSRTPFRPSGYDPEARQG